MIIRKRQKSLEFRNIIGELTKVEAKGIWNALGQKVANIRRITTKRGRYVKVGYDLDKPIKITELSCKPTFKIEFTRGHITDIYKIKLPDYDGLAYQIGDTATVSITFTGLETTARDIQDWISKFGDIKGEVRYTFLFSSTKTLSNSIGPVGPEIDTQNLLLASACQSVLKSLIKILICRSPIDRDGIGTDEWIVDIKLNQHIPEQLPIKGNRALVYYPGIPKQCKTCFETGHIASTCNNGKEDYLNYIVRFLKSGHFDEPMIGGWIDALKKYHPEYNRKDSKDLRQTIDLNKKGVPKQDLRRKIGPSSERDLRTNIGRDNQGESYTNPENSQERGRTPKRETYRGRARGRGHPPSRGHSFQGSQSRGPNQGNSRGYPRGGYRGYRGNRGNWKNFQEERKVHYQE